MSRNQTGQRRCLGGGAHCAIHGAEGSSAVCSLLCNNSTGLLGCYLDIFIIIWIFTLFKHVLFSLFPFLGEIIITNQPAYSVWPTFVLLCLHTSLQDSLSMCLPPAQCHPWTCSGMAGVLSAFSGSKCLPSQGAQSVA